MADFSDRLKFGGVIIIPNLNNPMGFYGHVLKEKMHCRIRFSDTRIVLLYNLKQLKGWMRLSH